MRNVRKVFRMTCPSGLWNGLSSGLSSGLLWDNHVGVANEFFAMHEFLHGNYKYYEEIHRLNENDRDYNPY